MKRRTVGIVLLFVGGLLVANVVIFGLILTGHLHLGAPLR